MPLTKQEQENIDLVADKVRDALSGATRQSALLALMHMLMMTIMADNAADEFEERFTWLIDSLGRHPITRLMRNEYQQ